MVAYSDVTKVNERVALLDYSTAVLKDLGWVVELEFCLGETKVALKVAWMVAMMEYD